MKVQTNILFKLSANLLIAACALCVLFGNGTHVHTVVDHLSDHGHVHIYVHSHDVDTNPDRNSGVDGKDDHQHPTNSIDLDGTLSQKTVHKVLTDKISFSEAVVNQHVFTTKGDIPLYLDLPPPDFLLLSKHFYSLVLRGPPLG